jgi:hypothetical protein
MGPVSQRGCCVTSKLGFYPGIARRSSWLACGKSQKKLRRDAAKGKGKGGCFSYVCMGSMECTCFYFMFFVVDIVCFCCCNCVV